MSCIQNFQVVNLLRMPFLNLVKRCTARLKRDDTRPETRFGLSENGRVHLNWWGCGGQFSPLPTTGSRVQDYWLPTPFAFFPFTSPTVRHHVPSGFN